MRIRLSQSRYVAVLVNQSRYFSSSYSPSDLVEPSIQFKSTVSDSKKSCVRSCNRRGKTVLIAKNDGISFNCVKGMWFHRPTRTSERLSLDVTSVASGYSTSTAFAESEEGQCCRKRASLLFISPYPGAEDITGFDYSPSHLHMSGLTWRISLCK
jgi:LAS superfamily LD-carboxypeptidase LdcB